jgi:hypothetical protein
MGRKFIWNWPQDLCLDINNGKDDDDDFYGDIPTNKFLMYMGNKSFGSLHCISNGECLY